MPHFYPRKPFSLSRADIHHHNEPTKCLAHSSTAAGPDIFFNVCGYQAGCLEDIEGVAPWHQTFHPFPEPNASQSILFLVELWEGLNKMG